MINYETLLSSYDDKLTLMQWLKKVEEALKGASAVSFKVNKRGDATLTFSVVFEDGSELETDPIILQQGESVQGAAIRNGHLILTLTNGDELDAGNLGAVSGFSINEAQHLIVTYQNGTTQDLGAIFTGNVTITGNLAAAAVKTASLTSDEAEISAQKPVVEVMDGYSFIIRTAGIPTNITLNVDFAGIVKNGNKLTFVIFGNITRTGAASSSYVGEAMNFNVPQSVAGKLYPSTIVGWDNTLAVNSLDLFESTSKKVQKTHLVRKSGNLIMNSILSVDDLTQDVTYVFRIEQTFLLSDNLAA